MERVKRRWFDYVLMLLYTGDIMRVYYLFLFEKVISSSFCVYREALGYHVYERTNINNNSSPSIPPVYAKKKFNLPLFLF